MVYPGVDTGLAALSVRSGLGLAKWLFALVLVGTAYESLMAADQSGSVPSDSIQVEKSPRKTEMLRLGYSGPSMGNIPLLMANRRGFLADEGFQIQFIQARSNVSENHWRFAPMAA